jgi:hypothetical protein
MSPGSGWEIFCNRLSGGGPTGRPRKDAIQSVMIIGSAI